VAKAEPIAPIAPAAPKAAPVAPKAAKPAIAAPAKPEAIEPAVEHVLAAATTVPKAVAEEKMVTMSERDIPITRPENYKYTPEELAQLKKQAAEAYLKWVELEMEISKNNLEQALK
jgi:vancomycin resistance protein YoaR